MPLILKDIDLLNFHSFIKNIISKWLSYWNSAGKNLYKKLQKVKFYKQILQRFLFGDFYVGKLIINRQKGTKQICGTVHGA